MDSLSLSPLNEDLILSPPEFPLAVLDPQPVFPSGAAVENPITTGPSGERYSGRSRHSAVSIPPLSSLRSLQQYSGSGRSSSQRNYDLRTAIRGRPTSSKSSRRSSMSDHSDTSPAPRNTPEIKTISTSNSEETPLFPRPGEVSQRFFTVEGLGLDRRLSSTSFERERHLLSPVRQ